MTGYQNPIKLKQIDSGISELKNLEERLQSIIGLIDVGGGTSSSSIFSPTNLSTNKYNKFIITNETNMVKLDYKVINSTDIIITRNGVTQILYNSYIIDEDYIVFTNNLKINDIIIIININNLVSSENYNIEYNSNNSIHKIVYNSQKYIEYFYNEYELVEKEKYILGDITITKHYFYDLSNKLVKVEYNRD